MAARNAGNLLSLALLACAALLLAPSLESFVVPASPPRATDAKQGLLAQGFQLDARTVSTAAAAGDAPAPPGKINLFFLATLIGTAVIGLVAVLSYGAYMGPGSSL
eukprot:CAMPEP_0171085652 /NCGR_PEP_ID=MMETSP0766_2-20121228/19064_1 /TAXON_ID=439317 /ORGANISM="Gambierdiscus australes, Strain CAWD 149" /LENGTH=105 /DNA_ID=CAMNT_0011543239 /DNA_START=57 /DNA_END=374 /DNA_ORIENTATION=+